MQNGAVKNKNELDLTSGKLFPKMIRLAVPLIITSVLQLLFNAADMIVVGKFDTQGDSAIAAIGSTTSVVALLVNFFIGLTAGTGVVLARCYGAKNAQKGDKVLHTSMIMGFVSGLVIALLGSVLTTTILTLMSCPKECFDLATIYLVIYFLGSPFNLVYNVGAAAMRSVGDTKRPLIFLTIAGIINIIVNLITVIAFNMSVAGVALATVSSHAVSAILVVIALIKNGGFVRLRLSALKLDFAVLKEVLTYGVPSGIQSSLFAFTNVLSQTAINEWGETVIAGNAAAANLGSFVFTVIQAIGNTTATAVGQNYGAKNFERIKKTVFLSISMVVVSALTISLMELIFANELLSLYSDTPEAIEYGVMRVKTIIMLYFIAGIMEVCNHSLRGIGYSLTPMLIALGGTCAFRLLWIYTVYPAWHEFMCLLLSWPASWTVTCITAGIFLIVNYKKRVREYEATEFLIQNPSKSS